MTNDLNSVLTDLNKKYGKGTVARYAEVPSIAVEAISTGSLKLDNALGIGGLPRGRICEVWGPFSSGKTTLALHCIAEAQKHGGKAAFIDAEHALDPFYATALGVDMDEVYFNQPSSGEEALDIVEKLASTGEFDIIVVDSVPALKPQAEIDADYEKTAIGLQARLMSKATRRLAPIISKSKTILLFINQIRMKIGVMYGSPETTSGGEALKFYASVRMDIRKQGKHLMRDGEPYGQTVLVKVVKNKVSPPHKGALFDIVWGEGIDRVGEILDLAVVYDIVDKSGAWYSYKDQKLGQGKEASLVALKANDAQLEEVKEQVLACLNGTS